PRPEPRFRWAPRSTGTIPAPPLPRAAALPTHAPPTPRGDGGQDPSILEADAAAAVRNSDVAWRPEPAALARLAPPAPARPSRASVQPPASTAPAAAPRGDACDGDEA